MAPSIGEDNDSRNTESDHVPLQAGTDTPKSQFRCFPIGIVDNNRKSSIASSLSILSFSLSPSSPSPSPSHSSYWWITGRRQWDGWRGSNPGAWCYQWRWCSKIRFYGGKLIQESVLYVLPSIRPLFFYWDTHWKLTHLYTNKWDLYHVAVIYFYYY